MRTILVIAFLVAAGAPSFAQVPAKVYPSMAPLQSYLEENEANEIALARSAAPASISGAADILIFDPHGYHRAVTGKNGWTCLVERSWTDAFDNPEFWNPRIRVPICFNTAASLSVLPAYMERTNVVLAKHSLAVVVAELKTRPVPDPERGSFAMMMSKDGYLADGVGPAGPHVMVFLANIPDAAWGANLEGSPVGATTGDKPSITVFYLPSRTWSDGTPIIPKESGSH
jgi:hypothetical protein